MPDSSGSPQIAVSSEIMADKSPKGESSKRNPADVQIDLGEVTQHNIKVLKKVNQVGAMVYIRGFSGGFRIGGPP